MKDASDEEVSVAKGPRCGARHIQVLLLFLLNFVACNMRDSLSVAIVAMTDNSTTNHNVPTYNWTNKNVVLSSFFWGYIIPQVFMAVVIKQYGTKKILIICMSINCVICMLTPYAADRFGSYGMMACRALQGLAQAGTLPSMYNVLSQWAPLAERSFLGALGGSGFLLGAIVAMPMTGFLCSSRWGWPATFYFNGTLGMVWLMLWIFLAADTPYDCKFISELEKKYITSSLDHKEVSEHRPTPWKGIFTSLPFLGIVLAQFTCSWGDNIAFIEMPSYIHKILKYNINANGVISSLPFAANFILGFIFGYSADVIIRKRILSLEKCRKTFVSIATVGPALCLVSLSFLPENTAVLSCLMMVLHQSFCAAYQGGISMSYLDISPNFCAILMSISNVVSTICDIVVPLLVQVIVVDETNKSQWRTIFLIAAAMYIFGTISFISLASGEVQVWDNIRDTNKNVKATIKEEQPGDSSNDLNEIRSLYLFYLSTFFTNFFKLKQATSNKNIDYSYFF